MDGNTPIIIGVLGTLAALFVFVNGWRMRRKGDQGRTLGGLHMLMAVLFVPMTWWIIMVLMPA
ncbi:hypothetical protein [Aurantiacibacter marinus]|uniref:Uncharacterized protein n=1 Tax=Aurantiacibacter marinus TaxID=874156 RepID=A0A0H0XRB6_9SPHN|nr:hypothetical protein [Aurantiacibacter marinus]KLI64551.1 hypothetical protein AAV99_02970 [Aurantiacibacter marinus]